MDDTSNVADQYTPAAAGSNRHTGKLPTVPKPDPINLLCAYDLQAGDVVSVDTGVYPLFETITLSGVGGFGWGTDVAFTMRGPTDVEKQAQFTMALPNDVSQSYFTLVDADYVTLEHLLLAGATRGSGLPEAILPSPAMD